MLKQEGTVEGTLLKAVKQPPSGGCVLKQEMLEQQYLEREQPPSGGCVLKLL